MSSFWEDVTAPVGAVDEFDILNSTVATNSESYFKQLGQVFKKAQQGALTSNEALKLGDDFLKMADKMDLVAKRLNAIALPSAAQAEVAIRRQIGEVVLDMRFWAKEVNRAAATGDIPALSSKAVFLFKELGAAMGIAQVGIAIYDAGGITNPSTAANAMAQKAVGFWGGYVGANAGVLAGAAAGSPLGPVGAVAGAILVGVGFGYLGSKAGEGVWDATYKRYLDVLPSVIDIGMDAQQKVQAYATSIQTALQQMDGKWLESSLLNTEQKILLTAGSAYLGNVAVSQALESDLRKIFTATFNEEALVGRDILLKSILTFAKENGYATERITANEANVTLDLPDITNSSVRALRDFAQKQLSETDQRGFSLTGPSRIVIATGAGTHSASSNDSLMIGSTGVDGLIGGAGDDDLIGGAGQDTLLGRAGVDDLFGGEGNDVLDGGAGGDWLYGGAGNDTYQLKSGELFDVIIDSDGNGVDVIHRRVDSGYKKRSCLRLNLLAKQPVRSRRRHALRWQCISTVQTGVHGWAAI